MALTAAQRRRRRQRQRPRPKVIVDRTTYRAPKPGKAPKGYKLTRRAPEKGAARAKPPKPPGRPGKPKKAPFDLTAPLDRNRYRDELSAATRLRYGESEAEIASERRISDQASANVGQWWSDYQQKVEQARLNTAQGYQQAGQATANQAKTSQAQAEGQVTGQNQQSQASADMRGATVGANPGLEAAAARLATSNLFGGYLASAGATQNAYMADVGRIGAGTRASELGKEAGRRRKVEESARKLADDKGLFKTDFRRESREAERKYKLELRHQAVEDKAFGLDTLKAQLDAADKKADRKAKRLKERKDRRQDRAENRQDQREKDRRYRLDREKLGADRADELWERRHKSRQEDRMDRQGGPSGSEGPSKFTPTQRRSYKQDYQQSVAQLRSDPKWSAKKADKFVDALVANGTPRLLARAAVDRLVRGGTSPALAKKIRRKFGIQVKVSNRDLGGGVRGGLDAIGDIFG